MLAVPVLGAADEVRIGMSAALSGPARSLGTRMKLGIEAYLHRLNRGGGVAGREVNLIALDDGYEPEAAARNMVRLIEDEGVVAIVGNVGTPTAKVTVPIATTRKTLLFGAFTGAGFLRIPPNRYVLNYRASYAQETAAMVEGLLRAGILPYEIAIFSQDDSYGDAGYQGVVEALEAAGYTQARSLPHGRYERNTLDVEAGLLHILAAPTRPRAIIMIGAYGPCARFIRMARRALPDTIYLNVSFVGSMALKDALGAAGEGVVVTQVVPHFASDLPVTREYRRDLAAYEPTADPGFVSLEGYIVARILAEGMRRAGADMNRESLIDGLLSIGTIDIGLGVPIGFSGEVYQASRAVWPTVIDNGTFKSIDLSSLPLD